MEGQLEALHEKREKLDDARVYDKTIDEETYRRMHDKLETEIVGLKVAIGELAIDELEIETVMAFATNLLENARNLWIKALPEQREKLQKVLFPTGLPYKDGEFGTTVTGAVFSMLGSSFQGREEKATRHGFEP